MHVPGDRRIASHATNRSYGALGASLDVLKLIANSAHLAHQCRITTKASERVLVRRQQRANRIDSSEGLLRLGSQRIRPLEPTSDCTPHPPETIHQIARLRADALHL